MNDKMKMPVFLLAWVVFVIVYFFTSESSLAVRIIFKAMPEILIITALVASRERIERPTFIAVMCALVFSILGDTAGEFKGGNVHQIAFITQIAMFVVAQICYSVSFIRHIEFSALKNGRVLAVKLPLCALFLAGLGIVAGKVLPAMGSTAFVIAGCVYMFALVATGLCSVLQTRKGLVFFIIGAAIFIFSDATIAINSFVAPVNHSGLIIMITYYVAQLLLNYKLISR